MEFSDDNIKVFVRLRPQEQPSDAVLFASGPQELSTTSPSASLAAPTPGLLSPQRQEKRKEDEKVFTFDGVMGPSITQEQVFKMCGESLVSDVLKGFNCTIFAYGQTGSGKSYTMFGSDVSFPHVQEKGEDLTSAVDEGRGLIPRTMERLFTMVRTQVNKTDEFLCKGSMVELYNEKIFDLLDPVHGSEQTLQLRESMSKGVYVENQTEVVFETLEDALETIRKGAEARRMGATAMNRESSRSHTVFTLFLESKTVDREGALVTRSARLNIVDLAGSERQKLTNASGERQKEANYINKSLLCLGTVISSLASLSDSQKTSVYRPHIKYRDSKLTFLLRDSLGGNSKTHMIANVNPHFRFFAESLSTIKFAQRAKLIRNKAKVNEDLTLTSVASFKAQIARLQEELAQLKSQQEQHQNLVPQRMPTTEGQREEDRPQEVVDSGEESKDVEELERLLGRALTMTEAARQRADELQHLVTSKGEACNKLNKALAAHKALLKLKTAQVVDCLKKGVANVDHAGWHAREEKLLKDMQVLNADAIEWRTKHDEVSSLYTNLKNRLSNLTEMEKMNRELCEETRKLLDTKRELQERLAADSRPAVDQRDVQDATMNSPAKSSKPQAPKSPCTPIQFQPQDRRLSGCSTVSSSLGDTPRGSNQYERMEAKILRKKLETKVKELEQALAEANCDELNARITTLSSELEESKHKCASLDEQIVSIRMENDRLRASEAEANKAKVSLEAKVQELEGKLLDNESLSEQLENITAQHDLTEAKLEDLTKSSRLEKAALEDQLLEARQLIEALRVKTEAQVEVEAAQEQQQQQLQSEVESLVRLREAQQRTDALRIANLKNVISELESKEVSQSAQVADLQRAVTDYTASVNAERSRREEAENELVLVKRELEELEAVLESERTEVEMLRASLAQAKGELALLHETQLARERQLIAQLEAQQEEHRKLLEETASASSADHHDSLSDEETYHDQASQNSVEEHQLIDDDLDHVNERKQTRKDKVASNMQEQLDTERALRLDAENKVVELQIKVDELAAANSKLAGNANLRQKIKYVQKLKDHIRQLEENETVLRKKIIRLQVSAGQPAYLSPQKLSLPLEDDEKENHNTQNMPTTPY